MSGSPFAAHRSVFAYVPAFTWAAASAISSSILARTSGTETATPLAAKSPDHLVLDVLVAGFLEIGGDHFLGIGGGGIAGHAEFFGCPQPEQLVAARLGLELLFLVEGELLLETFLALVESGHFAVPIPGIGHLGPRCGGPIDYLDRGGESGKQRAVKPQDDWIQSG